MSMELEFTEREKELYNKLESKRKRIEQNQRKMFKWADENKAVLLDRWGISVADEAPAEEKVMDTDKHYHNNFDSKKRWHDF